MTLESLLWLLPVMFMLHDLEEIIFLPAWLRKNLPEVQMKTPGFARRLLPSLASLSPSGFALAAAEEFVLIAAFTFLAVELHWLNAWAGLTAVFSLHAIGHLAQSLVIRRYVPATATGLLGFAYGRFALLQLASRDLIHWQPAVFSAALILPLAAANLAAGHWLGRRLDRRQRA